LPASREHRIDREIGDLHRAQTRRTQTPRYIRPLRVGFSARR
jgi:hypothetical protein